MAASGDICIANFYLRIYIYSFAFLVIDFNAIVHGHRRAGEKIPLENAFTRKYQTFATDLLSFVMSHYGHMKCFILVRVFSTG